MIISFIHQSLLNFGSVGTGAVPKNFKMFQLIIPCTLKAFLADIKMFFDSTVLSAASVSAIQVLINPYAERSDSYTDVTLVCVTQTLVFIHNI